MRHGKNNLMGKVAMYYYNTVVTKTLRFAAPFRIIDWEAVYSPLGAAADGAEREDVFCHQGRAGRF